MTERCTIRLSGYLNGRLVNADITADLDFEHTEYTEECYGPYRRTEQELDITGIENIEIHELEWEGDNPTYVTEYDDDLTMHRRWTKVMNRLPESWFDLGQIIYDNDHLWEELT